MLGPVGFDIATDRPVQRSINIARHDLKPMFYRVPTALDLDPLAAPVRLNERAATVHGEWLHPATVMLARVKTLGRG